MSHPLKKEELVPAPLTYKELVGELLVACPSSAKPVDEAKDRKERAGCKWQKSFDDLEGHLKECSFRIQPCELCGKKYYAGVHGEPLETVPGGRS